MFPNETLLQPSELPGVASAESGLVILEGPQGIAVTMTIEAALATAQSLLAATAVAEAQNRDDSVSPEF
ncbi:MAG: hypothetical protein NTX28_12890 [Novosphingobium sp.]|nr:hypothetical protein [Novosphingobium sp.]